MRILFLSHYFPPEVNAPASRTYEHCRRWVRAGHEVTVVTCVPNCPDGVVFGGYCNRLQPQSEVVDGIRVVRVWTYVTPNAGTVRRILNYLSFLMTAVLVSRRMSRPDVVVATSPQFFCGWAGAFSARLLHCPFVLEIRDIWPESIATVGAIRSGVVLRGLEFLERRLYRAADRIVAVGRGYRDRIISKGIDEKRVDVIMNGVDFQRFVPQADGEFRGRWEFDDRFVCSYVGTLGMAHGLEVVLKAAAKLRDAGRTDIHFCLVGDGAERKPLEGRAREMQVNDWVTFTGRLPRELMPTVLAGSDACLIHLRGCELFGSVIPSKVFETMAMQRPIIMGVRGEALDLVMDAEAAIAMEPDCADSLVSAVTKLADDRDLVVQLGLSAREFVQARFNRDDLAREYLHLLAESAGLRESHSREDVPQSNLVEQVH